MLSARETLDACVELEVYEEPEPGRFTPTILSKYVLSLENVGLASGEYVQQDFIRDHLRTYWFTLC